ncbi:MAG: hypothetical protein WBQ08_07405, partial [Candidatus Sulfotelmatobacter sp.]
TRSSARLVVPKITYFHPGLLVMTIVIWALPRHRGEIHGGEKCHVARSFSQEFMGDILSVKFLRTRPW